MNIVLHIGADKTGSTAIQQFFAQNIELLSAAGIEYPNILPDELYPRAHGWAAVGGINVNGNGYSLFEDFSMLERIVAALILDPVNQNKTFVFSSERLLKTFADESVWNRLAQISESNNLKVTVVGYYRDAIPYLSSIYNELIKSAGESNTFSDFVSRIPNNPHLAPHFNYFPRIIQLSNSFPQVKFSVFRYETHKNEIAEHFLLSAANTTLLDALPPKRDANRSLSRLESIFLTGLNAHRPDLGRELGWRIAALPVIDDKSFTLSPKDIEMATALCENYLSEMHNLIIGEERPGMGKIESGPDKLSQNGEAQIHQLGTVIGNYLKDGK